MYMLILSFWVIFVERRNLKTHYFYYYCFTIYDLHIYYQFNATSIQHSNLCRAARQNYGKPLIYGVLTD